MLRHITPAWTSLILKNAAKEFEQCLDTIETLDYYPHKDNVFDAFKYTRPETLKVIVLGQDPYPNHNACGLAFSSYLGVPPSLRNIYSALVKQNLVAQMPEHGILENWAMQGVLLLNTLLTIGKNGKKHEFWADFIKKILRAVVKFNRNVQILAWGVPARRLAEELEHEHTYYWGHPSPLNPNSNFAECDHFVKVNEHLRKLGWREICWDPSQSPENITPWIVATDGACPGNGRPDAQCSSAVYFPSHFNSYHQKKYGMHRILNNTAYTGLYTHSTQFTKGTNNRGEMMAVIEALTIVLTANNTRPLIIITDSEYIIKCINICIKNSNMEKFKNTDLLKLLRTRLYVLNKHAVPLDIYDKNANIFFDGRLVIYHQPAHIENYLNYYDYLPPQYILNTIEYQMYYANKVADLLACSAHKQVSRRSSASH